MRSRILTVFLVSALLAVALATACGQQAPAPAPSPAPSPTPTPAPAPAPAPEEPITLKFADFTPATMFPGQGIQRWIEEVEKRTNGKVEVEYFPGGSLLESRGMFDGVESGIAECGMSFMTYEPGRFPLMAANDLPVGYTSAKQASRVAMELYLEFQPEELDYWKVLWLDTCSPMYYSTIDPIRTLEDIEGMELRVSGSLVPFVNAMGGSGVGMPMSELPEALQKGVVKGYVSSLEVLMDFKFAEIVKYVADYPVCLSTAANVMNWDTWNSLPPDVQKVIDDLSIESAEWTGNYIDEQSAKSLEWAKKEQGLQVITLTPAEKALWDAILEPFIDQYIKDTEAKGLPGQDVVYAVYDYRDQYK